MPAKLRPEFTRHALRRMEERDVSFPLANSMAQNALDEGFHLLGKKVHYKRHGITIVLQGCKVITVLTKERVCCPDRRKDKGRLARLVHLFRRRGK